MSVSAVLTRKRAVEKMTTKLKHTCTICDACDAKAFESLERASKHTRAELARAAQRCCETWDDEMNRCTQDECALCGDD